MEKQEIKKRRLDLLNDTVEYYSIPGRRAVTRTGCSYLTEDGRMCAIGRISKVARESGDIGFVTVIFEKLEDDIKELGLEFLFRLQALHDNDVNWKEDGITDRGREEVLEIKRFFCE